MATLEGQTPAATFKDLLQVMNANSGIDGTLRPISDGEGTLSKLELSTTLVRIAAAASLILAAGASIDLDGKNLIIDTDGDLILNALVDDILAISAQGNQVFRVDGSVALPVNGIEVVASATGNTVTLRAFGSDANISIQVQAKGTGSTILFQFFSFDESTPSSVNGVTFKSSATGNAPSIKSSGTDTDIDLDIAGKGTGVVNLTDGKLQSLTSELFLNPAGGTVKASGFTTSSISTSSDINTNLDDSTYVMDTSVSLRTLTFRSVDIAIAGRIFFVVRSSALQGVTIATEGSETVNDSASLSFFGGARLLVIVSDGSNLFVNSP